jgi:hypothetical protein
VICNAISCLDAECHDGVDNVVVVVLECLDSLLARHTGLGHDKFDVLGLQAGIVDFFVIVIVFLLSLLVFNLLALSVLIVVIVTGVVFTGLLSSELLSGGGLVLRVEILDLGLTEDAITILVSVPLVW